MRSGCGGVYIDIFVHELLSEFFPEIACGCLSKFEKTARELSLLKQKTKAKASKDLVNLGWVAHG